MNEIEEVKARIDIVEFIGQYVQLQKAGRTYKASCPFHNERTPSFVVSPDRQSWHCFGACGTGGDVITFVMRRDGLEFPEALRLLAERAGVVLRERGTSDREDRDRDRVHAANEAAAQYFHSRLIEGDAGRAAREYVERRGIDEATAESFLLGYSMPAWEDCRGHLKERGFADTEMLSAGLLVQGESGLHDRFRGRLMFPIRDLKGRVIGFGARALDDSLPKYLNTAQTATFDKGGALYALDRAREAIRREGRAVIVEGYMDAIAAHQHGFNNVVASMGTALTERQVRLIKRMTSEIVLALDADAAGGEAAIRGHEVVRETTDSADTPAPVVSWRGLVGYQSTVSVDLRVAVLPDGRDPDEVIREDPQTWQSLIDGALPVLDYRLNAAAASRDLTNPRGRSQLVQEYLPLLTAVTDPVIRAHYLQRLSRLALVSESELTAMARRSGTRRGDSEHPQRTTSATSSQKGDPGEEFLLALLLQHPQLRTDGLDIPDETMWESENRMSFAAWKAADEIEDVKEGLPLELQGHLERLSHRKLPSFDLKEAREALLDCRRLLERRRMKVEKQALSALLADREDELGPAALIDALSTAEEDDGAADTARLQMKDLEAGLRLHATERSNGENAVETTIDG